VPAPTLGAWPRLSAEKCGTDRRVSRQPASYSLTRGSVSTSYVPIRFMLETFDAGRKSSGQSREKDSTRSRQFTHVLDETIGFRLPREVGRTAPHKREPWRLRLRAGLAMSFLPQVHRFVVANRQGEQVAGTFRWRTGARWCRACVEYAPSLTSTTGTEDTAGGRAPSADDCHTRQSSHRSGCMRARGRLRRLGLVFA
jgi:hypothetical protein